MKAVRIHAADDLRVDEIPKPSIRPDEVLVRMEWGGLCGSDLAYWRTGVSGTAELREPMVLGHEVAGMIEEVGEDVDGLEPGQAVTMHPATVVPGQELPDSLAGRDNLYPQVRYYGSAAFLPHEQGGFSEYRAVPAFQIRALPEGVSTRQGAVAEPLGVALHAINRAGGVESKKVLVSGSGPIGALIAAAAKHLGAASVTASDVSDRALDVVRAMGIESTVDLSTGASLPEEQDVVFEASGAPAALGGVFAATRRGGTVVQVGNLPSAPVQASLGAIITRELEYRGTYRFIDEISDALALMADGFDVEPLLTHTFDLDDAQQAFETAGDRSTGSSKVMLRLS